MIGLLVGVCTFRKYSIVCAVLCFSWFSAATFAAQIQFASVFVDHMVLQRGKPVEVWGTADSGAEVEVKLADRHAKTTAAVDGGWQATFEPLPAGGPYELSASTGEHHAVVHDLLIGDVWLCSGQSNMQFSLAECADGEEVSAAVHPNLRLGRVGTAWTKTPQSSAKIEWALADKSSAMKFSAVAYMFAHELEKDPAIQHVPIGLLEDCLGGTVIESWLPQSAFSQFDLKDLQSSMFGIGPAQLFNGMIAPLGRSRFAGVIWYQGEGNAGQPERYAKMLPLLFKTWRDQFNDPNLPMLVVQLPDYATDWGGIYWEWIREAQATAVAQTPNTALAVTINTNDGWNLHPQGKHEIGRRLALLARQDVYKEKVVGRGPTFKSVRVDGSKMVITFDTDEDRLTSGIGPTDGFMIAGNDGIYYTAGAVIDGNTVVITSPSVEKPQTVRYAWTGVPRATLTNSSQIPAAPFRNDQLPISKGHGEAQISPQGYTFKNKDYQITISGDGVITGLIVRNQQLLSNAPDPWGGGRVRNRTLSHLRLINPQTLVCSNSQTRFEIDFEDQKIRWTLTNKQEKEAAVFDIALSPAASVLGPQDGNRIIKRKDVSVTFNGIDSVMEHKDIAADDGPVLEATTPPGQTKVLELTMNPQ